MVNGFAFFKKELRAIIRTYRIWLVPLIFIFFGILSPVSAKFTPALLKSAMQSGGTAGMRITIPDPTEVDSYGQWLKNLSQLGTLAVILLSMGLVADEKARGTLAIIVTKPVSKMEVVLSKLAAQSGLIVASMSLGTGACLLYTYLLFNKATAGPLFLSTLAFGIFILAVLAVTLLFSTVFKSPIAAGGMGLLSYFALLVLSGFGHGLDKYTPGALLAYAAKMAAGAEDFSPAYPAAAITLALSAAAVRLAVYILNRQEI
ncbi:MAG: ABC transporter permease [Chloroflexi bacterium]|nr:ABC transporter permease [Chloroflexota bacterium]